MEDEEEKSKVDEPDDEDVQPVSEPPADNTPRQLEDEWRFVGMSLLNLPN